MHFRFWVCTLTLFFFTCKMERPDPASEALAILHKHPSDFLNELAALDALASREAHLPGKTFVDSIYRYASRLKPTMVEAGSDSMKLALLKAWVFDSLRIEPIEDSNQLAMSLPSQILATRKGSCLGLSLLFLALGQTLDLPLVPVFLPEHVFIRFRSPTFSANVETLRKGIARSDSFYRETFSLSRRPWYQLADGTQKQALAALVFNMGNLHSSQSKWDLALGEYRLVEEVIPGFPETLGSQGAVFLATGDSQQAEKKLFMAFKGDSLSKPLIQNLRKFSKWGIY